MSATPNNPTITGIKPANPNPTKAGTVNYAVTFSETVSAVDAADFTLTSNGVTGASITGVTGSADTYTVSVNTGTGDGTLELNLVDDDSIQNSASLPLGGVGKGNGNFTGEAYTIDKTLPTVTFSPVTPDLGNSSVSTIPITFSEPVTGFSIADLSLTRNGVAIPLTGATLDTTNQINWTLDNLTGLTSSDGDYQLTLTATGSAIADKVGNLLNTNASNIWNSDFTSPSAAASLININKASDSSYNFAVIYTDNTAVQVSSLDDNNILVTGPNGFSQQATLIGFTPAGNGTPRTATYSFTPPGDSWDIADNGTYAVQLQPKQVSDTAGNFSVGENLGTFAVNIAATPIPVPTPVVTATPTPTPTPVPVAIATPTPTPTPVPLAIATPTPTPTPVPVAIATPTPTPTPVPLAIATPTPTPTPVPVAIATPTPTPTPVPVAIATPTPTPTPVPVAIATPTPEPTPVAIAIPTPEPTPVAIAIPTPEPTPVAIAIPTPEPTPVPVAIAIPTPEPTPVAIAIPTPEPTPVPVAIAIPTPTPTPVPVAIAIPTPTPTPTPVVIGTPTSVRTPTPINYEHDVYDPLTCPDRNQLPYRQNSPTTTMPQVTLITRQIATSVRNCPPIANRDRDEWADFLIGNQRERTLGCNQPTTRLVTASFPLSNQSCLPRTFEPTRLNNLQSLALGSRGQFERSTLAETDPRCQIRLI